MIYDDKPYIHLSGQFPEEEINGMNLEQLMSKERYEDTSEAQWIQSKINEDGHTEILTHWKDDSTTRVLSVSGGVITRSKPYEKDGQIKAE